MWFVTATFCFASRTKSLTQEDGGDMNGFTMRVGFFLALVPSQMLAVAIGAERQANYIAIMLSAALTTLIHLFFTFPFVLSPSDLSESLSWNEQKTGVGKYMSKIKMQKPKTEKQSDKRRQPLANPLYVNLRNRLMFLFCKDFWKYMFLQFCIPVPKCCSQNLILTCLFCILKAPVVLLCFPFMTIPFYVIFYGMMHRMKKCVLCRTCTGAASENTKNASDSEVPFEKTTKQAATPCLPDLQSSDKNATPDEKDSNASELHNVLVNFESGEVALSMIAEKSTASKSKRKKCGNCLACMVCPFLLIGYLLTAFLAFGFCYQTVEMIIYLAIDVIRTLQSSLRIIIFATAIIVYLRQVFNEVNDRYRILKNATFTVLLELMGVTYLEKVHAVQTEKCIQYPLQIQEHGEIVMHRVVFDRIVEEMLPYRKCVLRMLLRVFRLICMVGILWWIIIDFQVRSRSSEIF